MYHYKTTNSQYKTNNNENKFKVLFILAIIALLIFAVLFLTGGSGIQKNDYIAQRNAKLRAEAQKAVNSVNSLSRLGASTSSAVLGKVRQYVHGIEVVNDLNVGIYGEVGRLYAQSTFETIYALIDEYESKLISGSKVNEILTSLSNAIEELSNATQSMITNRTIE